MMRVLDYQLGDRRDIAEELAHLREGSGHEDLATDLDTLAELYQRADMRPVIERDVKHDRLSGMAEALRLVDALFASSSRVVSLRALEASRVAIMTGGAAAGAPVPTFCRDGYPAAVLSPGANNTRERPMKNQTLTSAERTQPTTPRPERPEPGARARQLRTGVRAGDVVTLPKLDSPSKDTG